MRIFIRFVQGLGMLLGLLLLSMVFSPVSAQATGSISGRVTDANTGQPISNIFVETNLPNSPGPSACTDENGNYTLNNLPLDTSIKVSGGGSWCNRTPSSYADEWWSEQPLYRDAAPITLTNNNPLRSGVDLTLAPGGTISGTVTDTLGNPIQNMHVVYANVINGNDFSHGHGVCTDENGHYELMGVAYDISFVVNSGGSNWCDGTTTYIQQYWNNAYGANEANPITLSVSNPQATSVNFVLTTGGNISGRITDAATGQGIPNMTVNANFDAGGTGTCTDQNGNYTLSGLSFERSFRLSAGGRNWCNEVASNYIQKFWQNTEDWGQATQITIHADNPTLTSYNLALQVGGVIKGQVFDTATGSPLDNIGITVEFDNFMPGSCANQNGEYLVVVPFNRPFRLRAGGHGCRPDAGDYIAEYWDNTYNRSEAHVFTLTPDNPLLEGYVFSLDKGGTVSGRVTDTATGQGIPNMTVNANFGEGGPGTCTDQNGYYTLSGLSFERSFRLNAGGRNWCNDVASNYIQKFWQNTEDWGQATQITIHADNPTLISYNLALQVGGVIKGQVFDTATGSPLDNIGITVEFDNFTPGSCANQNGEYLLVVPFNRPFRLSAGGHGCRPDARDYITEYWDNTYNRSEAHVFTLTPDNPLLEGYVFSLDKGGTVSVRVTDTATGEGIPNISVSIDFDGRGSSTCADEHGYYRIGGIPYNTDFSVYSGGQPRWCGNHASYQPEYWQEAEFPHNATMLRVSEAVPEIAEINLTLALGGSISGQVIDQVTGQPIPKMNIRVDYPWLGACTDENGHYTIWGVPLDIPLILSAGGSNWCGGSSQYTEEYWQEVADINQVSTIVLTLSEPDATGINFTLNIGGSISGRVIDQVTGLGIQNMNIVAGNGVSWGYGTCTDENGYYVLAGVPLNEQFGLSVGGENMCNGGNSPQDYLFQLIEMPPLTEANPNLAYDFTVEKGGFIAGQVTATENDAPLGNIWVCAFTYAAAYHDLAIWNCAQTDPNGNYIISQIQPNVPQRVWLFPDDRLRLFYHQSPSFEGAEQVIVGGGETQADVDFSLSLATVITGTVFDEDGVTPLPGVMISTADGSYPECSQSDGSYRIFVPPGTHTIKASAGMCNSTITFETQLYSTPITASGTGDMISGINFVAGTTQPDQDTDGIPDTVEDTAPNNGDGNNDGTADSQQENVTSLPNAVSETYITVEAPAETILVDVVATADPSAGNIPPEIELPVGVIGFSIANVVPDTTTVMTIYLPAGETADAYYKYGPTADNPVDHWYDFAFDGTTGAVISGNQVTLYFRDGWRGDHDLAVNGTITDPGAPVHFVNLPPALTVNQSPVSADEGQTASNSGTVSDPNANPVSLSASIGEVINNNDGTWSWSFLTSDGPIQSQEVTIFADDGQGGTATITFSLMVNNVAPIGEAGADQTVYRNDLVSFAGTVTDPAGTLDEPFALEWNFGDGGTASGTAATYSYPIPGLYTVSLSVTDKDAGIGSDSLTVTVLNRAPVCDSAYPSIDFLWPPEHQMVSVDVLGVTDPEGDPITIAVTSIFQDEPTNGTGDGDLSPDGEGIGAATAQIRAERAGTGDGRMYAISFSATDAYSGVCTGIIRVGVKDNNGRRGNAIDGGALYDATLP